MDIVRRKLLLVTIGTLRVKRLSVIYFKNVGCLFVCLFYIKRKVVFRVSYFPPSLVLFIGPFKKRFLNKLALSISRLIRTLVTAHFCFHPHSYRSFVFSLKHVHVLFAVSRFSSIISFNSSFWQSAVFQNLAFGKNN